MLEAIIPQAVIDRNVLLHFPLTIIPRAIIPLMTELLRDVIPRVIIPWADLFLEELLYGNVLFKSHTFIAMTSVWLGTVKQEVRVRKPVSVREREGEGPS